MPDSSTSRWVVLPPHVLLGSVLLSLALDRWLPGITLWGSPNGRIGGAIMVVALTVNIYCAWQFHRRQTTIIPFRESTTLLTEGLYRYSRNPIYLSMVVLLIGLAIALGTLSPWLVPPAFAGLIDVKFIRREEVMLEEAFGATYRGYCEHVRRWL